MVEWLGHAVGLWKKSGNRGGTVMSGHHVGAGVVMTAVSRETLCTGDGTKLVVPDLHRYTST
jgi:hypothetical protein